MTEENKDSNPPKLRLSLEPREPKTAAAEPSTQPAAESPTKPDAGPQAKEADAAVAKPNLRLRRPDAEPEPQAPISPSATPEPTPAGAKPVEPPAEQAFDPENPFLGAATEPEPKKSPLSPPNLPDNPVPVQKAPPPQKLPQSLEEFDDEKKHKGLLSSILIIFALIIVLGACTYGLYYVLRSPSQDSNAKASTEAAIPPEPVEKESGSVLSRPIAKAKQVVAEMQDPERAWTEAEAPAPAEELSQELDDAKPAEPAEIIEPVPVVSPPSVNSSHTSEVSEFLQKAHIGGVRTGERPKLLLDGQSYDLGELIDPATGLRFIGLRDKKLAFQDAQGVVYIKSF